MNKHGLLLHHRVLPQLQKVSSNKEKRVLRRIDLFLPLGEVCCVICTMHQGSVTFMFILSLSKCLETQWKKSTV